MNPFAHHAAASHSPLHLIAVPSLCRNTLSVMRAAGGTQSNVGSFAPEQPWPQFWLPGCVAASRPRRACRRPLPAGKVPSSNGATGSFLQPSGRCTPIRM